MTTVYGVTMNGARRQIERQLKAIGLDSDKVGIISGIILFRLFKVYFQAAKKQTNSILNFSFLVSPYDSPYLNSLQLVP